MGLSLVINTPGTLSHTDYTNSSDKNYRSSEKIFESITDYEQSRLNGLNGFMLLMHIGAGPGRSDKFYERLPDVIALLKKRGYEFVTIPTLLSNVK